MVVRSYRAAVRPGFNLMEVLVVVAILLVIAGTGGVIYMRYLDESKVKAARLQVHTLTNAVEAYAASNNGNHPGSFAELLQPPTGGKPYLEASALIDPWGHEYHYDASGARNNGIKPDVWSDGPKPGDPTSIIGNWTKP